MPTDVKENDERSHSARYLTLIFLVLVAMCGVFFSAGFIVGRNERNLHAAPPTEVVNPPGVIPPTVNPPPDNSQPDAAVGHIMPNSGLDNVVIPPGGTEANPAAPTGKAAEAPPSTGQPAATGTQPTPNPGAGEIGEGITLQVVASHTQQDAQKVVVVLKDKGYPVFLMTPEYAHATDNLFRVLVGPFKTREDADKVRDKLKQDGFNPFIRH